MALGRLNVIDTATDKVVKTINVGKAPNGIALTPDNKLLLVTVYGENRLAFVDTSTQTVVAAIAVPKPHTVAISPDGKLAYVTAQEPGHFELDLIDLNKRSVVRTLSLEKHRATGSSVTTASCSTLPRPESVRSRCSIRRPTRSWRRFRRAYRPISLLPARLGVRHSSRAGAGGAALVRPSDEQAGAQRRSRQTAKLGGHVQRR